MIWETLNPNMILTDLDAADKNDVFRQLGSTAIREGYAKDSYVDALIEREANFPTALDIDGFGVAIPHTSVDHVLKPGTGIGVLKNPVTFVQMGTDDEYIDVKLIVMLCVVDPDKHLDELQRILAILQDKAVLEKLQNTHDKQEVIDIIKEKESTL